MVEYVVMQVNIRMVEYVQLWKEIPTIAKVVQILLLKMVLYVMPMLTDLVIVPILVILLQCLMKPLVAVENIVLVMRPSVQIAAWSVTRSI